MKELLIVTLAMFICALPLALFGRRLWRWLRRDNLVAELTESQELYKATIVALREANTELDNQNDWRKSRIAELESASRTDHATIGDLHDQLAKAKRQLATAKGQVSRLKKLAGVPVKAPARKRGGK